MVELEGPLLDPIDLEAPWDWAVAHPDELCEELARLKTAASVPGADSVGPADEEEWQSSIRDITWRLRGLRGEPPEEVLRRQIVEFGPAVCRRLQLRCFELSAAIRKTQDIELYGHRTLTFVVPAPYAERFDTLVLGGFVYPAWIGNVQLSDGERFVPETLDDTPPRKARASLERTGARRVRRRSTT